MDELKLRFLVGASVFGFALAIGGVYLVSTGVWIGLYFVLVGSLLAAAPAFFALTFRRAEGGFLKGRYRIQMWQWVALLLLLLAMYLVHQKLALLEETLSLLEQLGRELGG